MSFINKDNLTQFNIEQAIQRSFNIKKSSNIIDNVSNDGIEISGYAIASQEAHTLNEILGTERQLTDVSPYYFAPNGKWSVINFNKIKIRWADRCRQVQDDNGCIWNIVSGHWRDRIFIPDVLSNGVHIEFESLDMTEPEPEPSDHSVLLPHTIYRSNEDISTVVPQVRFSNCLLECIRPLSLETISINRQGIYINRKFRDKIDLCDCKNIPRMARFRLRILYGKQLLSSTTYLGSVIT
jgi:hypothetical protein